MISGLSRLLTSQQPLEPLMEEEKKRKAQEGRRRREIEEK